MAEKQAKRGDTPPRLEKMEADKSTTSKGLIDHAQETGGNLRSKGKCVSCKDGK